MALRQAILGGPDPVFVVETGTRQAIAGTTYLDETSLAGSTGAAAGTGTATGTGGSLAAGTGAASGTGTAAGVGAYIITADGAAAGVGALAALAADSGVGSAAGTGTVSGVGASLVSSDGTAGGAGALAGVGAAIAAGDGAATGTGTALGVGPTPIATAAGAGALFGRAILDLTLTDTIGIIPVPSIIHGVAASATDTIALTDPLTSVAGWLIAETLALTDTPSPIFIYPLVLADSTALAEQLAAGWSMSLADAVVTASTLTAWFGAVVEETIGITPVLTPAALYHQSLADATTLADVLALYTHGALAETITLNSTLSGVWQALVALSDTVTITPTEAPQWLLGVVTADSVTITPTEALRMLYAPVLTDGVELVAGYISPGDSLTTWVTNTRTGAVTEYQNYAFNSFARIGNKYVGASDAGLYELLGDDDAGTDIVASLKGGFLQFGGTHLSRLKAAYIAMRGEEDDFVLRVETMDGATYTYQTATRSGRSSKVHMGKGQRARYFAWELVSTGQDFDLDTLEFVPIVVERRV